MHTLLNLPKAVDADGHSGICDLRIVSIECGVWPLTQLVFELELHLFAGLQCIGQRLLSSNSDVVLLEAMVQLHTAWKGKRLFTKEMSAFTKLRPCYLTTESSKF